MDRRLRILVATIALTLAAAALAQPVATPIFGRPVEAEKARDALDVSVSLLEGYDDNLASDVNGQANQAISVANGGYFSALAPHLEYVSHSGKRQFVASV